MLSSKSYNNETCTKFYNLSQQFCQNVDSNTTTPSVAVICSDLHEQATDSLSQLRTYIYTYEASEESSSAFHSLV